MPIVIDGNNLLHRLPRSQRSRTAVRRQVLEATRHETVSVTVVFDGPPPAGAPDRERLGSVTVVYSGAVSADDVIVGMVPSGATARQWVVVTDDRGLAERARARGAEVRRLGEWRRRRKSPPRRPATEAKLSGREVAQWERYFSDRETDD